MFISICPERIYIQLHNYEKSSEHRVHRDFSF
jgi:hypothetical protein